MGTELPALKQPLTLLEKLKAGVKGIGKGIAEYIPRGIIFSSLLIGGSTLLGAVTGIPALGSLGVSSVSQLPLRMGLSLLLGSTISGGMGFVQEIKAETQKRDDEILAETQAVKSGRVPMRALSREVDYESAPSLDPRLPYGKAAPVQPYR